VWKVERELPALRTDRGKPKVIIKNLIGNAIKFTAKRRVAVGARARHGGVGISVTGTGIGREAQALIFEPFRQLESVSTRYYGGNGFRLHIVQRLLELLKGTVTVESEVGRGLVFRVWVPHSFEGNLHAGDGVNMSVRLRRKNKRGEIG
jgi:two-component system autoinducer 2 sensor kinase/phosphatase LuxQ